MKSDQRMEGEVQVVGWETMMLGNGNRTLHVCKWREAGDARDAHRRQVQAKVVPEHLQDFVTSD
jgi:hypothetical protein